MPTEPAYQYVRNMPTMAVDPSGRGFSLSVIQGALCGLSDAWMNAYIEAQTDRLDQLIREGRLDNCSATMVFWARAYRDLGGFGACICHMADLADHNELQTGDSTGWCNQYDDGTGQFHHFTTSLSSMCTTGPLCRAAIMTYEHIGPLSHLFPPIGGQSQMDLDLSDQVIADQFGGPRKLGNLPYMAMTYCCRTPSDEEIAWGDGGAW